MTLRLFISYTAILFSAILPYFLTFFSDFHASLLLY